MTSLRVSFIWIALLTLAFAVPATSGATTPSAPANLAATTISPSQIILTWQRPADSEAVDHYQFYRNGTLFATTDEWKLKNVFLVSGLAPETTYTFHIIAFNTAGTASPTSVTATATTLAAGTTRPTMTIHVDGRLTADITNGTYSIANRAPGGSDGNAYTTFQAALNGMTTGDSLFIRGGTYYEDGIDARNIGTAAAPVIIRPFPGEVVVVDGQHCNSRPVFDIGAQSEVNYVTIDGLTIQNGYSNGINIGYAHIARHIEIRNCTILNWRFVAGDNCGGVHANRFFEYVTVQNCRIVGDDTDNQNYSAVHIMYGDGNIWVRNNDLSHAYNGVWYKHATTSTADFKTVVENNYAHKNQIGIMIANDRGLVRNNLVTSNRWTGICLWHNAGGPRGSFNTVSHNTVYNSPYTVVVDCGGGRLDDFGHYGGTGNTIVDNALYGTNEELSTLSVWTYVDPAHKSHAEHATFSDYNLYHNTSGPEVFNEFRIGYTLATWTALYPDLDQHSIQSQPVFSNGSGSLTAITDFTLTSNSPGTGAASDGTDMGADVALIGIQTGPDSTPPTTPKNLAATIFSAGSVALAWNASNDVFGVTGYRVLRDGTQVGTTIEPSFSESGLIVGTTYSYTVTAFDAAGNSSASSAPLSIAIHDETFTTFAAWVAGHFTAAEQADVAVSGPDADPDGCGLTNLARYAFGLPARGPAASPISLTISGTGNDQRLTLTFPHKGYAPGLSYVVQSSTDLVTWADLQTVLPGYPKTISVTDPIVISTSARRFLRLRVLSSPMP